MKNFPGKNAQSCFPLMNHVFSFSSKFLNFPFKVGPPSLMLLSPCWSEDLALVNSHDATTQTDRTGKGARLSSPQTDKSALMSAWFQSLSLLHHMMFVFALHLRTYLYPQYADTKWIWAREGVQTSAGGSEDVIHVLVRRAWMSHAKSLWEM